MLASQEVILSPVPFLVSTMRQELFLSVESCTGGAGIATAQAKAPNAQAGSRPVDRRNRPSPLLRCPNPKQSRSTSQSNSWELPDRPSARDHGVTALASSSENSVGRRLAFAGLHGRKEDAIWNQGKFRLEGWMDGWMGGCLCVRGAHSSVSAKELRSYQ